jgi:stress response protein YsnF
MEQRLELDKLTEPAAGKKVVLAVVEEELAVGTQTVETGARRFRKVRHEEMLDLAIPVRIEEADVQRVERNLPADETTGPRQEGDTWVIPVYEWVPVTEMRLMLKEEIRITKRQRDETVHQRVPVTRETVVMERRDGPDGSWRPDDPAAASQVCLPSSS